MADAKQNFDDTTKFMSEVSKDTARLLEAILAYLEAEARNAPEKELAAWIKKHGQCAAYEIQGNCAEELKRELTEQGVPYIDLMDGKHIIIKAPDCQKVTEANYNVLVEKANYFQEVDNKKFEEVVANSDRVKDKNMVGLHGLDNEEYEMFKNNLNNVSKGFTISTEQEGKDKHAAIIMGRQVFNKNPEKTDVCKAYAQMSFSLYGANAEIERNQIIADNKLEKDVFDLKDSQETKYLVSVDDPRRYIEINAQGFEFHQMTMVNGKLQDIEKASVDKTSPMYDVELQKAMDKMENKKLLDTHEDLAKHCYERKRTFETDRPEKNEKQEKVTEMEKNVVDKANEMIKNGPLKDTFQDMTPKQQFKSYQHEMKDILDAVIEDKEHIHGYSKKDLQAIKDEFKEAGVDPKKYSKTSEKLASFDIEMHQAKKTRSKDKNKESAKDEQTKYSKSRTDEREIER